MGVTENLIGILALVVYFGIQWWLFPKLGIPS